MVAQVTVAVPTGLPCRETMKLADCARAAEGEAKSAARAIVARLRTRICTFLKG